MSCIFLLPVAPRAGFRWGALLLRPCAFPSWRGCRLPISVMVAALSDRSTEVALEPATTRFCVEPHHLRIMQGRGHVETHDSKHAPDALRRLHAWSHPLSVCPVLVLMCFHKNQAQALPPTSRALGATLAPRHLTNVHYGMLSITAIIDVVLQLVNAAIAKSTVVPAGAGTCIIGTV